MVVKELIELGLSGGEAKAYLALVEIGPSSVGPIAKKSGVSYSKIYEVLTRLVKKGLVSYTTKQKTKYYQPLDPSRISEYLDSQEKVLFYRRQKMNKILPELIKLKSNKTSHEAEIFVGLKGLRTAYDILVKDAKNPIYFTYIFDKENQVVIDKFYGDLPYYKTHQWRGITTRDYQFTHFTNRMHKNIKFKKVNFPLPATVDIADDKVLQTAWSGTPIGILIHSEEISKLWRKYCDDIWNKK